MLPVKQTNKQKNWDSNVLHTKIWYWKLILLKTCKKTELIKQFPARLTGDGIVLEWEWNMEPKVELKPSLQLVPK